MLRRTLLLLTLAALPLTAVSVVSAFAQDASPVGSAATQPPAPIEHVAPSHHYTGNATQTYDNGQSGYANDAGPGYAAPPPRGYYASGPYAGGPYAAYPYAYGYPYPAYYPYPVYAYGYPYYGYPYGYVGFGFGFRGGYGYRGGYGGYRGGFHGGGGFHR